jgi:purine-cytosine permease-like protein
MPILSDYNRFAKESRGSLFDTFVGFAITNVLFYFGGQVPGRSNIICATAAIQSILFGLILLMFILHETSNAFADVYSKVVSTQNIFHKIKQIYLIICGFTVLSIVLAIIVPISQYERFLLLIEVVFVPLFGIVISDNHIVKDRH